MNNNGKKVYPIPKKLYKELKYHELVRHRKFNCIFYDICVDHAATFQWQSFSCFRCQTYFTKKEQENLKNKKKLKIRKI